MPNPSSLRRKPTAHGLLTVMLPSLLLLGSAPLSSCSRETAPEPVSTLRSALGDAGGKIHGVVRARVDSSLSIAVPDVKVYARGAAGGSEPVSSDGNGRFALPELAAGGYLVCWSAEGFGSGCRQEPVQVRSEPVYVALELSGSSIVHGRVTLADGSNPRVESPFLAASIQSYVVAVDRQGKPVSQQVRANDSGDYVLAGVASTASFVRAEVEQAFALTAVLPGGEPARADLRLENHSPEISLLVGFRGNRSVRHVEPGAEITVLAEASDPDEDKLTYQWGVSGSEGEFVSEDAPAVLWKLPTVPGRHSIYLLVRDEKGGSAQRRLDIVTTDDGKLYFGGTVVDAQTQEPISEARISVNGEGTETDREGGFWLGVPEDEGSRYVLNINQDGYQLYSRVLGGELMDDSYALVPAFRAVIDDPSQPAEIVEERRDGRPGTVLQFEPDVLVDEQGEPARVPLTVYVATVDPQDPQGRMPGNMGALSLKGEEGGLVTFGAVDVRIRDEEGRPYNVARGRSVKVRIPVDPSLRQGEAELPDETPLWYYDEGSGSWREEEGVARLDGDFYVIDAPHFSVLNADLQFTNPACLRVTIDTARLSLPVKLRVTATTASNTTQVFTFTAADPLNVIAYLPPNKNVKLQALDSLNQIIPISTRNISSGNPVVGPGLPPYPYTACNSAVTMTLTLPSASGFLTHAGVDTSSSANAYYTAIGAGTKPTLAAWKTANGFGVPDADAVYFNHGDLGFGRWMHMKKKPNGDMAYYVSNYPNANAAAFARLTGNPSFQLIATVAMEYSPLPGGGGRVTKFYVYNNAGNLVPSADLDGAGQKFVPALCITCHGGVNGAPSSMNSRFLPFALESFRYPTGIFTLFGYSRAAQEPRFRKLNEGLLSTNYTPAMQEIVCRWHGAASTCTGPLPLTNQNSAFVPAAWAAKPSVYSQVVQPSCRACHVARLAPLDWAKWDGPNPFDGFKEFGSTIKSDVCSSRVMPQAKRTYENFWLSTTPHQPAVLANAGLNGWLPTDPCP